MGFCNIENAVTDIDIIYKWKQMDKRELNQDKKQLKELSCRLSNFKLITLALVLQRRQTVKMNETGYMVNDPGYCS